MRHTPFSDNDPFDDDFIAQFRKQTAGTVRRGLVLGLCVLAAYTTLSVVGLLAVVYGIVKILQHTGVI